MPMPVRVDGIEVRRLRLPLRTPFRTTHGDLTARDVVVVRVVTPDGEGWGECSAWPLPGYDGDDLPGAWAALRRHLAPALLATGAVPEGPGRHRSARAALVTALLDARLRAEGRSLAAWLGAPRPRVPAGAAVGLHADLDALVEEVGGLAAAGYRRVKVKIAPGWDLAPLAALRDAFPGLDLQADANGSYDPSDAAALEALDPLGLLVVEQPFPPGRLADHAALAARLATPVGLDEDVVSAQTAAAALDAGACTVVCVKPGRVGGPDEARRVVDACAERGAGCWVGGMVEAGLGKAVAVAVAALDGCTLPGDLPASDRWFATDLTEPFVLAGGHLAVPTGPGLGVAPRADVLGDLTAEAEWVATP